MQPNPSLIVIILLAHACFCLGMMWMNSRAIARDVSRAGATLAIIEAKLGVQQSAPAPAASLDEVKDAVHNALCLTKERPVNASLICGILLSQDARVNTTYDRVLDALFQMAKEEPPRVVQDPPRFWRLNKVAPENA